MKKLTLLLLMALSIIQCQSQEKKEKEPMQTYTYKNDSRIIYGIDLTVPGPFELYINDIAARKDYATGMNNTLVDINPYVLKSGKYKFRLRVFPVPSEAEKGGIQPETLHFLKVGIAQYKKVLEGDGAEPNTYKITQEYPIPKITQPVPYLDIAGEFEVELPYELEGWSKGQDLSKWDKEVLQKKVVAYHEKMRTILNNGNAEEWLKFIEKRREETYIFNYTSNNSKESSEDSGKENIKNYAKNNMVQIENYQMYLYAHGRIVSLERIDGENKGEGVLRTLEPDGAIRLYNIKLYLPEGSEEFVIIRK